MRNLDRVPRARSHSGMTDAGLLTLPFGSWPTPITSELVVRAAARLGAVALDGDDVWWSELRPVEGGRTVIVRNGVDVLASPWNARTAVHEYGGGAWWVRDGTLWFVNWADQRLYRLDPGGEPVPVTPEPEVARGERYADGDVHPTATRSSASASAIHRVADQPTSSTRSCGSLPSAARPQQADRGRRERPGLRRRTRAGRPTAHTWAGSSGTTRTCRGTAPASSSTGTLVAGGPDESVLQPRWAADGTLWFLSDRTGWWNLYRVGRRGPSRAAGRRDRRRDRGAAVGLRSLPLRRARRRTGGPRVRAGGLRPPRDLGRRAADRTSRCLPGRSARSRLAGGTSASSGPRRTARRSCIES